MANDLEPYANTYSENGFWDKLKVYARQAGRELVEKALLLFYAAQRPEVPVWARSIIYGALGYFILPADAIPDLTPLVGYSDDLGALALALATVAAHINDEVRTKTQDKLRQWFGETQAADGGARSER